MVTINYLPLKYILSIIQANYNFYDYIFIPFFEVQHNYFWNAMMFINRSLAKLQNFAFSTARTASAARILGSLSVILQLLGRSG